MFRLRSNKQTRRNQRGQAMVIFVLASTVILGAVALTVDIGQAYVVRRHAQNIADQAALVGAQQLKANPSAAISDALANAVANGVSTGVTAVIPPGADAKAEHRTTDYIEVTVQRQTPTFFAGIIGQGPSNITARAVAKGRSSAGYGAIIALSPNKSPTAMEFAGGATTVVKGGVWSNGLIKNTSSAGSLTIDGTAAAVQGFQPDPPDFSATSYAEPATVLTDPLAGTPIPSAGSGTVNQDPDWDYTWAPGTYDSISVPAGERHRFVSGIYVITKSQGLDIRGTAVGVEDDTVDPDDWPASYWDTPPTDGSEPWGPVHFYLSNDKATVSINSQATVRFQADESVWKNIVFWSTYSGNSGVGIEGGADVALIGTIYCPDGMVSLAGGADVPTVRGQVIANRVFVGGNAGVQVEYVPNATSAWQKVVLVE